ncbi:MAG: phosphate ABC transporter permease subunit PstC [Isosphaeraceae bacterium]|nr:phosphate ABC transporter permease subunit PstC [Isosphaeraceae bacterium]
MAKRSAPHETRWAGPSRFTRAQEVAVRIFFFICAAITILTTLGILFVLGSETLAFFRKDGVSVGGFLLGTETTPDSDPPKYGLLPMLWGTFVIALGSSAIALPIGLASAIFLSEYAPRSLRAALKPTLELLAGVPSIVYGYLALLLVTPVLKAILEPLGLEVETFNVVSACIVVGIMVIPLVSSLSEDVLSAVPRGLREAAYGLGATKFEVSVGVVLPAALSGVVASFLLAISRAVGETMAVVLAAGSQPRISLNILGSVQTMTAYIVAIMGGEAESGSAKYLSLFAVGLALFTVTLTMNLISQAVLRRYREVYS